MNWSRRTFAAACVAFGLAAGMATSGAFAGPALQLIERLARSAEPIVNNDGLTRAARTERLSVLMRDVLDREDMAKSLLGRYWRRASAAQRDQLVPLLDAYLIDVYAGRIDSIDGDVLFQVDEERDLGDRTLVESRVQQPGAPDIIVTWQVEEVAGRLVVTDIVVEGVSLVISQRADFASVIRQQGGLDGLIAVLRDKVGAQ